MKFRVIFNGFKSLKIWVSDFLHLWRAITATRFSLKSHSVLTLWEMWANCLGTSTWRVNSPKITNLWTLLLHCLQLLTTWNLGQNLWHDYAYCILQPVIIVSGRSHIFSHEVLKLNQYRAWLHPRFNFCNYDVEDKKIIFFAV
jgi:hypothetical protein